MACLGGTPEAPRPWARLRPDGSVETHEGRICNRTLPFTSRRVCSACPAYRGTRTDTSRATGLYPSGEPYALSANERREYEAAMEAALVDDDFAPITAWETRLLEGIGDRTLRAIGDPDALDRRATYMRAYRGRQSEDQRARQRDATRDRVRRFRLRGVVSDV